LANNVSIAKGGGWRQLLSTYDITYEFLPGKANVVADAMSRLFDVPVFAASSGEEIMSSPVETSSVITARPDDLSIYHSGIAGHFGLEKTMQKLRRANISYKNMYRDVKAYIKSCPICQRMVYKPPAKGHTFSLEKLRPNEMVSMDSMGPIDADRFGFSYVLVIIDGMTKFTRLYPLQTVGAEDCAARLLEFICKDGLPSHIHSDKGTQFVNDVIQELLQFTETPWTVSTPYSHEENGLVERVIKDVRAQLKAYCIERGDVKDWSLILPMVERIINTKINTRINHTPAALKYGYADALEVPPFNVSATSVRPVFNSPSEYLESISRFQAALIATHNESIKKRHEQLKEAYKEHDFETFAEGTLILVDNVDRTKSNLTELHRDGPFLVREQRESTVTYEDQRTNRIKDAHVSRCHVYTGRRSDEEELATARANVGTYEVESIRSHKFVPATSKAKKSLRLEVKWKDYEETSWEPIYNNASMAKNIIFLQYARNIPAIAKFVPADLL
jgi:hypothetical protein